MADPLEGLKSAGFPVPPKAPKPNTWNQGSNGQDPALDRAVWGLQAEQPMLPWDVDIKTMPWKYPYAGSNILGTTDVASPNSIQLNPAVTMAFPQNLANLTLVHEMEHVKQGRSNPNHALDALKERALPYEDRPSEIEANKAEAKYGIEHGLLENFKADPAVLNALPKMLKR